MDRDPVAILRSAARAVGRSGLGSSLAKVAREAGVSPVGLRRRFSSREELFVEAWRATVRELHERFAERARRGEGGLPSALDALDAMWTATRGLQAGAPFIVQAFGAQEGPVASAFSTFTTESTHLLEDGIRQVFGPQTERLAIPPDRMAILIRVLLSGLVVELARAKTPEEVARVDQAYADARALFQRFALGPEQPAVEPGAFEPIPLPW